MVDDFLESKEFVGAMNAYRYAATIPEKDAILREIKNLIRAKCSAEWKPIDTAPKDQSVLMFRPGAAYWAKVAIGAWEEDTFSKRPKPYWEGLHKLGRNSQYREWEPTHWMPLPDDPKVEE